LLRRSSGQGLFPDVDRAATRQEILKRFPVWRPWSRDGKQLAVFRGITAFDIVLMSDFK